MARFRYRMQNILNVKEKLETQAKNEFAIAAAKEREEEEKLRALNERRDGYEARLKGLVEDKLKVIEIKEAEDDLEIIKYHVRIQELNLAAARQELEVARQKLTVAMQERRLTKSLRRSSLSSSRQKKPRRKARK